MTLAEIVILAAEETEHHGNVALETFWYGAVALAVFGLLAEAYAKAHANDVQKAGHGH